MDERIIALCETLRTQGVKRARLSSGELTFVEFFERAAELPTASEETAAQQSGGDQATGFERALGIFQQPSRPADAKGES